MRVSAWQHKHGAPGLPLTELCWLAHPLFLYLFQVLIEGRLPLVDLFGRFLAWFVFEVGTLGIETHIAVLHFVVPI